MTRLKRTPIPDQEALEDRMLLDLFQRRHVIGKDMQHLADYTSENEWRVLAHLAQHEDVVFVGDGQVMITHQGLGRITEKHPELRLPSSAP
jgi:hypothetical protein